MGHAETESSRTRRCRVKPLDAKDRLIPGALIGHEAIAVAANHQVEIFEYHHPEKNVLAKHHSRCHRCTSKYFNGDGFRHVHFFNTAIGVFRICASESKQSKT